MLSYIQNALANLKAHKIRVSIAILWIIIGITSVILIGSIGNGAKKQMAQSVDNMINNSLTIEFVPTKEEMNSALVFMNPITEDDLAQIKNIKGIKKISQGYDNGMTYGEVKIDNSTAYSELYPINESGYDENKGKYEIVAGRDINENDKNKTVMVLNQETLTELNYSADKILGHALDINGILYEVIGIMTAQDGMDEFGYYEWNPLTYASVVPKSTMSQTSEINKNPSEVYTYLEMKLHKGCDIEKVKSEVISLLEKNHPDIEGTYSVLSDEYNPADDLNMMLSGINKFVLLVTVISMFVGGIGVMNIMYISVIERKREIGIRRAIGASPTKIVCQFLIESTVITVSGCILGLIVGSIAMNAIAPHIPFKAIPSADIYLIAVGSSIITGIVSGVLPAFKAAKIDPIEAIKG